MWFYTHRAFGRHRDHLGFDCLALARGAGRTGGGARAQCTNNLKQLGLALANYESANNCLPIAVVYAVNGVSGMPGAICTSPFGDNCQNTPWFVLMLPYLEQAPLYNAFNASIGIEGPALLGYVINSTVMTSRIASFQCPSDNIQSLQHGGLEQGHRRVRPRLSLDGRRRGITASIGETWILARAFSVLS